MAGGVLALPTAAAVASATLGLISFVLLLVTVVSPAWVRDAYGSLGLNHLCVELISWDTDTQSNKSVWSCFRTYDTECTATVCSYLLVGETVLYQCRDYSIFYPTGFQNTPTTGPPQATGNTSLANPDMLFPGEGSCSGYVATRSLLIISLLLCIAGFCCVPFTCCWYTRTKEIKYVAIVLYSGAFIFCVAAVSVFAAQVYNSQTSTYGVGFWLTVVVCVTTGLAIPALVLSPARTADEVPPFGTPGFPYDNPDKQGLHLSHEPSPDPLKGMASSSYPQPGNNWGRGAQA
eukprot:CAMPEP_0117673572 /NCGR_PEP_ID=MMETSP0804-20121206/14546_1 /TAXON_ID=1074897 /ORGANISM="Tetraselmis astigmatica, Strain CCMP880" /LENGTH=289 /DNA_ID=CAMNT_0005482323 /DNA_START=129 /DNA_END=998 /DNA_ORIENTATION=+